MNIQIRPDVKLTEEHLVALEAVSRGDLAVSFLIRDLAIVGLIWRKMRRVPNAHQHPEEPGRDGSWQSPSGRRSC